MALSQINLRASVTGTQTKTVGSDVASFAITPNANVTLSDGTGAGQANQMFYSVRTLTASSSEDLDLAAGATMKDVYGATITFTKIKGVLFVADAANSNDVVVGAAATATFLGPMGSDTDTHTIRPGGWYGYGCGVADSTGYAVAATTADLLTVTNSAGGTSVIYTVVIIGVGTSA